MPGARSEAGGYAAFLQNAGKFCRVDSQGCTLDWYAMPRWGMSEGYKTTVINESGTPTFVGIVVERVGVSHAVSHADASRHTSRD